MWRVTLKGLLAHKLRLALTALAIVLGVGFVAGTYVLTDTINKTFTQLFQDVAKGTDVAVRSKEKFSGDQGDQRTPIPASVRDQIAGVDGVKAAEGGVSGYAQFIGRNGKPVTTGGAPTLGVSVSTTPQLRQSSTLRSGAFPTGPDQVVVDARTASKQGFTVGSRVKILFQKAPREFTVSGVVGFGEADNLAGATLAGFDTATAQDVLNRKGVFDEVDVVAVPGVGHEALRDRISARIGPSYEALTGKQLADENAKAIGQFTKFINIALLAFAFVALFVGSFIIVNTFSIILAQRTRELALLRCMGASRRQLLRSVLTESAIVGLLASIVGIGAGILIALALQGVFGALGVDLPSTSPQIRLRTIIVALVVGLVVTMVASLMPALRATRVAPVAAVQEATTLSPTRTGKVRIAIGAVMTVIGIALLLTGLFNDKASNRLATVATGAVVIFLGVAVLSPLVARPMSRVIGWPFAHWAGEPGRLARQNAMRIPRRTASTAAALMIGLALVSLVTIFAASLKASFTKILDESVAADYILSGPSGGAAVGFSPDVVTQLSRQPQIDSAVGIRTGSFKLDGKNQSLNGVDPIAYDKTVRTETTDGKMTDLTGGGIAVREDVVKDHGWKLGDAVAAEFPVGGTERLPIKVVYKDNQLNGGYLIPLTVYQRHYQDQLDVLALVKAKSGVPPAESRAAIDKVVAQFPTVQVRDQAEFKDEQAKQVNQILVLFYILLALAVIIAFIGIINTLALSVLERIRELGLLRAVGMTRGQLRAMIRWEAVIISVLGAVLGLAVGIFFGWTLVSSLKSQGITEFQLPIGTLIALVVAAGLVGVVSAILPGRRAARIDVLRAVTTE
ncbi:FtsX-like permease family protein [Actinomadura barringtoniae]|uniref:FtsX-like permease family protein n=1 Tax=Actinomadura barringtoniae TaxID=1427535 RepID=A0A939PHQ1_9ACTN|nr:ABC transporter permease [Actinomadura barringtoniae]MBO2452660.1 FtsX-like permease family protein [Actinomadura barringtoniae]